MTCWAEDQPAGAKDPEWVLWTQLGAEAMWAGGPGADWSCEQHWDRVWGPGDRERSQGGGLRSPW